MLHAHGLPRGLVTLPSRPAEGIHSFVWPECQGVSGVESAQNQGHVEAIIVLLGMLQCNKLDADLQEAR